VKILIRRVEAKKLIMLGGDALGNAHRITSSQRRQGN